MSTGVLSGKLILTLPPWLNMLGHGCDHAVDWSNVKVLSNPRDYTTCMLEEAVFIRQTRDTLNRDCGSLPAEYENLFEKGWTLADPSLS